MNREKLDEQIFNTGDTPSEIVMHPGTWHDVLFESFQAANPYEGVEAAQQFTNDCLAHPPVSWSYKGIPVLLSVDIERGSFQVNK